MKLTFNINDKVRVKLTDKGRQILRDQHDELRKTFPSLGPFKLPPSKRGWTEFQWHDLMSRFGEHMMPGFNIPFETTVEMGDDG